MGITRDANHKKRATGGKKHLKIKKRKHNLARQASNTRIGEKKLTRVRVRGGNFKNRALFLDSGNFSIISVGKACRSKIFTVAFNFSSNELARTNTLVKGSIVLVDANPFKNNLQLLAQRKFAVSKSAYINQLNDQFNSGRLLARICSRPGQSGRADGYILENEELEFYSKKISK
mmetsp:Transcript_45139/g.70753  ORF Transcript_45139/g.70753 Transcript_45139/m.70753 type:complete len:175 (+) Transcript_45139:1501-2025(+)